MIHSSKRIVQPGFSTVELLISLFIAAIFLLSGYQLYTYVVRDGQETALMAKASDIAYQHLRSIASNDTYVKESCSTTAQPGSQSLATSTGLNDATVSVVISCPQGADGATLLTATVTYKSPNGMETVSQGMYAGKDIEVKDEGSTLACAVAANCMQDVTSSNCPTTRTMKVDARDDRTYWVQKLGDGKCWMLTNLAYAGGGNDMYSDTRTLSNGTSDSSATYTEAKYYIPTGANPTTNPTEPSTSTTGTGQYGYLYNFCGANGGQVETGACSSSLYISFTRSISVCPKNWRLPTASEFDTLNLVVNYGSGATDYYLRTVWLAQRSGAWDDFFMNNGIWGHYWSSDTFSVAYASSLTFNSSEVNPTFSNWKRLGLAVRCVAN